MCKERILNPLFFFDFISKKEIKLSELGLKNFRIRRIFLFQKINFLSVNFIKISILIKRYLKS